MRAVTRPHDLAARIRRARNDAGLSQQELGERIGVHWRTVQGWESGRVPRKHLPLLERALGVDLTTPPESDSPRLDDATDAQVIASLATRLADRDRTIRELRDLLDSAHDRAPVTDISIASGRWAARTREPDDTNE